MSLSPAATDVEDAVRSETVSDSNVRETVKRRVEERLDDLDAFDSGGEGGNEDSASGGTDTSDGADEPSTDDADPTDSTDDADGDADADDDADTDDPDPTDGQVSMEDYL